MSEILKHQLPNGLVVLADPVEGTRSLAMTLLTPAGLVFEPDDQVGVATMLAEMICRGAGGRDARAHCDALDLLGVQRSSSVQGHHHRLGAAMLAERADEALPLLWDMICRPMLSADTLEPARDLALQELDALADDPQQRVMIQIRQRHLGAPLGRSVLGSRAFLEHARLEQIQAYARRCFSPAGAILAFAGHFDWDRLRSQIEGYFGDWQGSAPTPTAATAPLRGYDHETADTTQVHIALATEAVPETDRSSMLQKAAVAALSGGMSGRLFTEVREKRGLCYSVFASYSGLKEQGVLVGYAGTTVPRAQETLSVMMEEFRRLAAGIDAGEFQRAIVGMKSRLVMQGESTTARAAAIASDQFLFGRPRGLEELAEEVGGIRLEDLNAFLAQRPLGPWTLATIGPDPLVPDDQVVVSV